MNYNIEELNLNTDNKLDVGVAGCESNIQYYRALRHNYIEQAIQAYTEEVLWQQRLNFQTKYAVDMMYTLKAL